jgi:hypothetical protein
MWYQQKRKFIEGVEILSIKISTEEFEIKLAEMYDKFKSCEEDFSFLSEFEIGSMLSNEERILACKSLLYLVQRLAIFIITPGKLQSDLSDMGFKTDKVETILKFYSSINRDFVKDLHSGNEKEISWNLNTILYDDDRIKSKKNTAKITISSENDDITLDKLDFNSLSKMFNVFEDIQKELDSFPK